jgi:hypothetical protein
MRAKMKYICKKFINHQIKKCLLFRCRHAASRYNANFKLDQSVFAIIHDSPPYFWDQWDDHPSLVTHARDYWWTLDFVSPGVNSREELVPSHGASRRRLGDYGNQTLGDLSLVHIYLWYVDMWYAVCDSAGIPQAYVNQAWGRGLWLRKQFLLSQFAEYHALLSLLAAWNAQAFFYKAWNSLVCYNCKPAERGRRVNLHKDNPASLWWSKSTQR